MQSTTLLDYNSVHYNSSATSQVRPPHTSTTAQFTSQETNPRLHDISHHGKSRLQRNACQITPRLHDIPCQPSATPQVSPPQNIPILGYTSFHYNPSHTSATTHHSSYHCISGNPSATYQLTSNQSSATMNVICCATSLSFLYFLLSPFGYGCTS